ncbi:GAF domain-containing protein [Nocardia sp. CA2R105]|uniref:GAF domain-containing protein n=1 Tax=Nocardia coffeae TaxID=2873381 RepID=UPI001CA6903B|nr:GAF domain-containing protein [Nocardia coffeae]MBY8861064.1 GAF domain-containing protein [Nocardia coffeae]
MSDERGVQEALVEPLAQITANLVRDADVASTLPLVDRICAQTLHTATSAVMIVDPRGGMQVLSSADDRSLVVRLLEDHAQRGPWNDSVATMDVVGSGNIGEDGQWPGLSRDAMAIGYRACYAAPMVLGEVPVGSLAVFYHEHRTLDADHRALVRTLADLTTLSLCQESDETRQELLARRALAILDDRVRYEHALGLTSGRLDVDADRAAALLEGHARARSIPIAVLSRDITNGTFDWVELDPSI